MLRFQNVTKLYNGIPVLDNISLDFVQGKLYALIGPNGSGKTTMMKAAAGLVKPESGQIFFNGAPIGVKTRADIAYMPTEPYYYNFMSIADVGKYHKDFYADFDMDYYKKLLSYMELSEKFKVKTLSSGMNAKLKIAATLSRRAKVVMLDEPLNGIDVIARDQIISSIISSAAQGGCFLISSHLFDELEPIVHDVVMVRSGKIIISGDINEIRKTNNKSISDLYREIYGAANFNPYANMYGGNMVGAYGQPMQQYPQYPQYPQQGMPQYPQYPRQPQQGVPQYPQYPQHPQQGIPQHPQYPQQPHQGIPMPQAPQSFNNSPNAQQPAQSITQSDNVQAELQNRRINSEIADINSTSDLIKYNATDIANDMFDFGLSEEISGGDDSNSEGGADNA